MTIATAITARRSPSATQPECACGEHLAVSQACCDNQRCPAGGDDLGQGHMAPANQPHSALAEQLTAYRHLRTLAEMLWDLQQARIAISNRALRADIDPALYEATLSAAERAEHVCRLGLARQYRATVSDDIRLWQRSTRGVGEHLLASLLGVIGHPVWTEKFTWDGDGTDRHLVSLGMHRRRVSDLWSYCGHGDPTRRPRRGMTAEEAAGLGAPRAKTIVWLLACAQLKSTGPYRSVYDAARAKYEERDWTPGHRHNAALRLVGKHMLRDLWHAAGGAQQ